MLVVFGLEPLENTLSQSLSEQRFLMVLLVLFATLALVLAAVGIHGVLSYTVAHRSREIGIRMALGANAQRVVRAVVAQGATLTVLGLVLGFTLAMALGRFLSALLFGVTPRDAATLATVILVLGIVATLSVWLPARRAARPGLGGHRGIPRRQGRGLHRQHDCLRHCCARTRCGCTGCRLQ
jgi:ABC-type antimicrobial peptide transport system permease subunit